MLQIACHSWAFNDRNLEEAAGTIARLGFRYLDLGSGPHLDLEAAAEYPEKTAQHIREVLSVLNLSLTDLYLNLPYINSADEEDRQIQLGLFTRLIPFALAVGTPGITISPGILHPDGDEHSLARSIPALLEMSQAIEDTDLRLSYEPHLDSPITTPEKALHIVECVPGLSLSLDYAHFIAQGFTLGDLTPLLPHTAHVHLRQAVKGRLQTPFDAGRIDLAMLMNDLDLADYHGILTIEYMTLVGWHGLMDVNIPQETVKTRDALRTIRTQRAARGN